MSKQYLLDIETCSDLRHYKFPLKARKILVVCWKELRDKEVKVATTEKEIDAMLDIILSDDDNILITHNISFDATVLNMIMDRAITCRVLCTFRLGRLMFPFHVLGARDMEESSKVSNENVGKCSLDSWGERLGLPKDAADLFGVNFDWTKAKLSDDMIEYCVRDVELLEKLYRMLMGWIDRVEFNVDPYGRQHKLEASMGYFIGMEHDQCMYHLNYEGKLKQLAELQHKLQKELDHAVTNQNLCRVYENNIVEAEVIIEAQAKLLGKD